MAYTLQTIMQFLADLLLPLFRIAAMLMVMVGIGAKTTPTRVKLMLAVAFTVMVLPVLPKTPFTDLFSGQMILVVVQQVILGAAIGFVSVMLINTFVLAGQIVAMQTGLGFASIIDPTNGSNVPAVGQFYLILATLLFWEMDGHLLMLQMVVHSFTTVPIDGQWWPYSNFEQLALWGGWMFATALALALAPLTAMLVVNFAFGVMTRAAPQLNVFSIGFPITLVTGLMIIWLTLSNFLGQYDSHWQHAVDMMCDLVGC